MPTLNSLQETIKFNDLEFWTEQFGDKNNPGLILIIGSGGQGIMWPQELCEQLASQGYFVIRYDHRDTGLSSSINFQEAPYNLLDMAKDVIGIIDHLSLQKVHVVGASMGGSIAMLLGEHFPERIASLVLMMATVDMRPVFDSLQGIPTESKLSKPADAILESAKKIAEPPKTLEKKVEFFLENARINSGGKVPIDELRCREIGLQYFMRMQNPNGGANHFQAIMGSYDLLSGAPGKIKSPTLIIHGDSDPVFPIDHAYAIQEAIPHANLMIIPGLGHGISNGVFVGPLVEGILSLTRSN